MNKYRKGNLPGTPEEALEMAADRDLWAKEARDRDQYGTAIEWEITASLLRFFAEHFMCDKAKES